MQDYIARGISDDKSIRVFAAVTTLTVEKARTIHNTTPVATSALGRTLTASAIMGVMLKGEKDTVTVQIKGNGKLGGIVCVSDSKANVRGYVHNPEVDLPLKDNGKLDVSGAIGQGYLNIIKDIGLKEPYIGQVPLISGEIAEDLAYYFLKSEQINSCVGLGVLIEKDYHVEVSGGFIIQVMPDIRESELDKLDSAIKKVDSVTSLFKEYKRPEEVLKYILKDFNILITETIPTRYFCTCSKERIERALISMGKEELKNLIQEQGEAEISCHFCNKKYLFDKKELQQLYNVI